MMQEIIQTTMAVLWISMLFGIMYVFRKGIYKKSQKEDASKSIKN